ncbi:MAG: alpha/beta hydrolase [Nitriliruptorales bacterium]|nr:alpha/beta hydrolase [Nitriliruptorales bacterium]
MQTRFATTEDEVRIAYEVRDADAPAAADWVLLIHGLGYARWGWEPVVDDLQRRLRVVLFDNRGIGESDVPEGPYTARQMAGDALAVLDDAGIDAAHVIGTSLGGMIAQELALLAPDRVDRLVLVASTPGGERAHPMPQVTQDLIARMPEMAPEEALREAIANALTDETVAGRPEVVERILHHRTSNPQDPAGWQAQAAAGTGYDGGERLADIAAPTLVLHGDQDVVVAPGNAAVLAELIDDSRVEIVEGTGHLLFWERPDHFVALVTDFLGSPADAR